MKKPRVVSGAGFKPETAAEPGESEPAASEVDSSPASEENKEKEDPMLSVEPTESEKLSASEVCAPFTPSYYTAADLAGKNTEEGGVKPGEEKKSDESKTAGSSASSKPAKKPRIIATYDYSLLTKKDAKDY